MAKRPKQGCGAPLALDPALLRRVIVEGVTPQVDEGRYPGQAHGRRRRRRRSGRLRRRPRPARGGRCCGGSAASAAWRETPMDGARQRSLARGVHGRVDVRRPTSSPSKAGSIASRPGGTGSRRRSPRARTSRSELLEETAAAEGRGPQRAARATTACCTVIVERERARFGAWYEMFPRSAGTDPSRSAHVRRSRGAAALRRVDGLRRALPAADPSDRPELPQGAATTR